MEEQIEEATGMLSHRVFLRNLLGEVTEHLRRTNLVKKVSIFTTSNIKNLCCGSCR